MPLRGSISDRISQCMHESDRSHEQCIAIAFNTASESRSPRIRAEYRRARRRWLARGATPAARAERRRLRRR